MSQPKSFMPQYGSSELREFGEAAENTTGHEDDVTCRPSASLGCCDSEEIKKLVDKANNGFRSPTLQSAPENYMDENPQESHQILLQKISSLEDDMTNAKQDYKAVKESIGDINKKLWNHTAKLIWLENENKEYPKGQDEHPQVRSQEAFYRKKCDHFQFFSHISSLEKDSCKLEQDSEETQSFPEHPKQQMPDQDLKQPSKVPSWVFVCIGLLISWIGYSSMQQQQIIASFVTANQSLDQEIEKITSLEFDNRKLRQEIKKMASFEMDNQQLRQEIEKMASLEIDNRKLKQEIEKMASLEMDNQQLRQEIEKMATLEIDNHKLKQEIEKMASLEMDNQKLKQEIEGTKEELEQSDQKNTYLLTDNLKLEQWFDLKQITRRGNEELKQEVRKTQELLEQTACWNKICWMVTICIGSVGILLLHCNLYKDKLQYKGMNTTDEEKSQENTTPGTVLRHALKQEKRF